MGTVVWIILGIVVLGGRDCAHCCGVACVRWQERDPVLSRLAEATERGELVSLLEDIELQQPFIQRVIVPMIEGG